MTKAKKSNRSKAKNPNLNKRYNTKIRQLYMDQDYLEKLNPEELAWYDKFLKEELNANFTHTGKDFNKSKKSKRKLYNDNNARNRCLFNNLSAIQQLGYMDDNLTKDYEDNNSCVNNTEDILIELIDNKDKPIFNEED